MKKILSILLGLLTAFVFSCSNLDDISTLNNKNIKGDKSNARIDCELCLAPGAEILSITNGTNCSNVVNFRIFVDSPVSFYLEKSSNTTNWYPIKYYKSTDYSIGAGGIVNFSFADLNPYQPIGSSSPNILYYRIKLLTPSAVYSPMVSKISVTGCSGLPNTIFNPQPSCPIVAFLGGDFSFSWSTPGAGYQNALGNITSYTLKYKFQQGAYKPGFQTVVLSGGTNSVIVPSALPSHTTPVTITYSLTVEYETGEIYTVNCTKVDPLNY